MKFDAISVRSVDEPTPVQIDSDRIGFSYKLDRQTAMHRLVNLGWVYDDGIQKVFIDEQALSVIADYFASAVAQDQLAIDETPNDIRHAIAQRARRLKQLLSFWTA